MAQNSNPEVGATIGAEQQPRSRSDYWRRTVPQKLERLLAQITLVRILSKFSSTYFCLDRLLAQTTLVRILLEISGGNQKTFLLDDLSN